MISNTISINAKEQIKGPVCWNEVELVNLFYRTEKRAERLKRIKDFARSKIPGLGRAQVTSTTLIKLINTFNRDWRE